MTAAKQLTYAINEEKYILRTLLYFDIFNYPLTEQEIARFSPAKIESSCKELLTNLVSSNIIYRFGDFYTVQNKPSLVERRIKGNALAEKKMHTARKYSRIIASFPFVRAVLLSGSISKNYMDEKSDIDYFIITEKDRLWIVRISLAIFRRIILLNSRKNFCTNYFIDTQNLNIPDRNIFTAIELFTLKSTFGRSVIQAFCEANNWVFSFLPQGAFEKNIIVDREYVLKKKFERIFSDSKLNKLNRWLMNKAVSYWKQKYTSSLSNYDFENAFRSTIGISKSHPQYFQKRALTLLDQKIQDFESQHKLDLSL